MINGFGKSVFAVCLPAVAASFRRLCAVLYEDLFTWQYLVYVRPSLYGLYSSAGNARYHQLVGADTVTLATPDSLVQ